MDVKKEIIRITDPDYLLKVIGPMVVDFADRLNFPGISYESLMTYLMFTPGVETYVALADKKAKGFMVLSVCGPPYYSTATCSQIYKPGKDDELMNMMCDEILSFMKRKKVKYFYFTTFNEKLGKYLTRKAKRRSVELGLYGYYFSGKRIFRK